MAASGIRPFRSLSLALCLSVSSSQIAIAQRVDPALPEYAVRPAEGIVFEVDPRIELLAAAQAGTDWVRGSRGPAGSSSRYFNELAAYAAPRSRSAAVRRCERLMRTGFSYDAPCALVLSLEGGKAMRPPAGGWPERLARRAFLPGRLAAFASALAEYYRDLDFDRFLAAHEAEYRLWLEWASGGLDAATLARWLEDFYRPAVRPVYHFVLAPAMFPAGGYGFSLERGSGDGRRLHVYQVIRARGKGDLPVAEGQPGFPSGCALGSLAIHEFGHSFVDPALAPYVDDKRLAAIYEPVEERMRRMAYGSVDSFLNELVIRAATVLAERELEYATPEEAERELRAEEAQGFYPIRRVLASLEDYVAHRAEYPSFREYAPSLLGALAADSEAIAAEGKRLGAGR